MKEKDLRELKKRGYDLNELNTEPPDTLKHLKGIQKEIIPYTQQKEKPLITKLGFFGWILLILGCAIGLYALSTPSGSIRLGDFYSWEMWMFGYNRVFESGVGLDVFWVINEDLFVVSWVSTTFVIIGNILSLISAGLLIKKGAYVSYSAIIAPGILVGSIIFYLAGYEVVMYSGTGESFWSLMNPDFAIWGQFLAAFLMVLGFFISRSASKYVAPIDKEPHQEKVFALLNRVVETKFMLPHEKEQVKSELNVISLRLKGVVSLKRDIERGLIRRPDGNLIKNAEHSEGIEFFEEALEKSPSSMKEISNIDLDLAKEIFKQQDKDVALFYLNKISDNTTILIGKTLKKVSP